MGVSSLENLSYNYLIDILDIMRLYGKEGKISLQTLITKLQSHSEENWNTLSRHAVEKRLDRATYTFRNLSIPFFRSHVGGIDVGMNLSRAFGIVDISHGKYTCESEQLLEEMLTVAYRNHTPFTIPMCSSTRFSPTDLGAICFGIREILFDPKSLLRERIYALNNGTSTAYHLQPFFERYIPGDSFSKKVIHFFCFAAEYARNKIKIEKDDNTELPLAAQRELLGRISASKNRIQSFSLHSMDVKDSDEM